MWMDGATVGFAAAVATLFEFRVHSAQDLNQLWLSFLAHGPSTGLLLLQIAGFIAALILFSHRLNLYCPTKLGGFLHEQRLSVQSCFISSLLLTGTLYLVPSIEIPHGILLLSLGSIAAALSARRFTFRWMMYRRFERGKDTRNVLIVGTGHEAQALRHHVQSIPHLGYAFKGFIEFPKPSRSADSSADVLGSFETLFQNARKQFVDEIFFTTPPDSSIVLEVLDKAREYGIDLRIVPHMYDGLAWRSPIEYVGQFPTIPLHSGKAPEFALFIKRGLDIAFSGLLLLLVAPAMLAIAIAIKLDTPGPVFYRSERIGKKGRTFRCFKFRTMVPDAEARRADIMHMNERDGVLFKISNDPRITRIGRILRKYSLDELPQFFNVLSGDMSVVGPRPPIASEVREYKLSHLRRLDVTPGITGLWQVQGRQDPSFDSYISLDVTYIENWSVWLDIKIIIRTVAVVFAGTGS